MVLAASATIAVAEVAADVAAEVAAEVAATVTAATVAVEGGNGCCAEGGGREGVGSGAASG